MVRPISFAVSNRQRYANLELCGLKLSRYEHGISRFFGASSTICFWWSTVFYIFSNKIMFNYWCKVYLRPCHGSCIRWCPGTSKALCQIVVHLSLQKNACFYKAWVRSAKFWKQGSDWSLNFQFSLVFALSPRWYEDIRQMGLQELQCVSKQHFEYYSCEWNRLNVHGRCRPSLAKAP